MITPVVLAGPTASGKSDIAIQIGERSNGHVICGDSRQLYAGMQIGAAAPSPAQTLQVKHMGFGVRAPEDGQDAQGFITDTDALISRCNAEGKQPIVVGGAGLYLRSLRYGLSDVPQGDPQIRDRLKEELHSFGLQHMHERLVQVDPKGAQSIHPNDPVRIIRALELHAITGKAPSEMRTTHGSQDVRIHCHWILLQVDMSWLSERLQNRVRLMFDAGLVEEAIALRDRLGSSHHLLETMGYKEALLLHDGELSKEEAVTQTYRRHRQYARRQRTWFQKEDWWQRFDASSPTVAEEIADFLNI